MASGTALAPLPLEEDLFDLSVSSRADGLPRLAASLRAIASDLRLRRERSLAFDPDGLLERTATAHVLAGALASADPARRARLAGAVRRAIDLHFARTRTGSAAAVPVRSESSAP